MTNKKPDKDPNKWMVLISMPIQMGIIIFLFSWFGGWLDDRYDNGNNINVKIFTLLGVFVALYNVIRQVNQLRK